MERIKNYMEQLELQKFFESCGIVLWTKDILKLAILAILSFYMWEIGYSWPVILEKPFYGLFQFVFLGVGQGGGGGFPTKVKCNCRWCYILCITSFLNLLLLCPEGASKCNFENSFSLVYLIAEWPSIRKQTLVYSPLWPFHFFLLWCLETGGMEYACYLQHYILSSEKKSCQVRYFFCVLAKPDVIVYTCL